MSAQGGIKRRLTHYLERTRKGSAPRARIIRLTPHFWIFLNVLGGLSAAVLMSNALRRACLDATTVASGTGYIFGLSHLGVAADLCLQATKSPPWFLFSGLAAGPSILLTWYWRDQARRDANRLATEGGSSARYTKAAELLASAELMPRINGLFALWDLARESPSHRGTIARTLAAFIATKTTLDEQFDQNEDVSTPSDDVLNAFRILADREWSADEWRVFGNRIPIDLRWKDLQNVELEDANLEGSNLAHSYLTFAKLRRAAMQNCDLSGARM